MTPILEVNGTDSAAGSSHAAVAAAAHLAIDAELLRVLLCDVYANDPAEGIRIFFLLAGDSLEQSVAVLRAAEQADIPALAIN